MRIYLPRLKNFILFTALFLPTIAYIFLRVSPVDKTHKSINRVNSTVEYNEVFDAFEVNWTTATFEKRQFLINNPVLCSKFGTLTAFIFVQMSVVDFNGRSYLRDRWLSPYLFKNPKLTSAFMVGLPPDNKTQARLEREARKYGDIIQANFTDTYRNQTIKNIAALQWIAEYCRNAFYVIKTDADVFINIVPIMDSLEQKLIEPRSFGCIRSRPSNMSSVTFRGITYPEKQSPPYCGGPFYIHGGSLVPEYLRTTLKTPYLAWLQDVFMTGVVRAAMPNVPIDESLVGQWYTPLKYHRHYNFMDCAKKIETYVIHRNDHKFHQDFHYAWYAALTRLPPELKLKVNDTFLVEAKKHFTGC